MWPVVLNNMKDAMSFLNAQSDYFGSCGEHIADNIELSLNFRWDMSRAREMCIAHQNPDTFNLIVSYFTFCPFLLALPEISWGYLSIREYRMCLFSGNSYSMRVTRGLKSGQISARHNPTLDIKSFGSFRFI